jgi:hypothetical protein
MCRGYVVQFTTINKQIFTPEQETKFVHHLRNRIETRSILINKTIVRQEALLFYNQLHPHNTRTTNLQLTD